MSPLHDQFVPTEDAPAVPSDVANAVRKLLTDREKFPKSSVPAKKLNSAREALVRLGMPKKEVAQLHDAPAVFLALQHRAEQLGVVVAPAAETGLDNLADFAVAMENRARTEASRAATETEQSIPVAADPADAAAVHATAAAMRQAGTDAAAQIDAVAQSIDVDTAAVSTEPDIDKTIEPLKDKSKGRLRLEKEAAQMAEEVAQWMKNHPEKISSIAVQHKIEQEISYLQSVAEQSNISTRALRRIIAEVSAFYRQLTEAVATVPKTKRGHDDVSADDLAERLRAVAADRPLDPIAAAATNREPVSDPIAAAAMEANTQTPPLIMPGGEYRSKRASTAPETPAVDTEAPRTYAETLGDANDLHREILRFTQEPAIHPRDKERLEQLAGQLTDAVVQRLPQEELQQLVDHIDETMTELTESAEESDAEVVPVEPRVHSSVPEPAPLPSAVEAAVVAAEPIVTATGEEIPVSSPVVVPPAPADDETTKVYHSDDTKDNPVTTPAVPAPEETPPAEPAVPAEPVSPEPASPVSDAALESQLDALLRRWRFIDIHPNDIAQALSPEDWQTLKVLITDDQHLAEVKELFQSRLGPLFKSHSIDADQPIIVEAVISTIQEHLEIEVARQLSQFDTTKAHQIGVGVTANIAKAMLVGSAVAATGLSGGTAAVVTGGVLATWRVFKGTAAGKKLDRLLHTPLWGKSNAAAVAARQEAARTAVLDALSPEQLAAVVSNTIRRASSPDWQDWQDRHEEVVTRLEKNPDDFTLWQQQAEQLTDGQRLVAAQALLELQNEYPAATAEQRLHMALQMAVTAGMYERTQQRQSTIAERLQQQSPQKFAWLKKYGDITSGKKAADSFAASAATIGLGAATTLAIRSTGWGRIAAGALGGALAGLALAEGRQQKNELVVWKEIDALITTGESKIRDASFPSSELEQLQTDAQLVESQLHMGLFTRNVLLQQRAENFIYQVQKLVAENTAADELLTRTQANTKAVEQVTEQQVAHLGKSVRRGRLSQTMQVVGGAVVGGLAGLAGAEWSEHQAEVQMEHQLDSALQTMPDPVRAQVLEQLGTDSSDVKTLTPEQLAVLFPGGKFDSAGFARQANEAYSAQLTENGFTPAELQALDTDPLKRLGQLRWLQQEQADGVPKETLLQRLAAPAAAEQTSELAVQLAGLGLNDSQMATVQKNVLAGNGMFDRSAAEQAIARIQDLSTNVAVRQQLTDHLIADNTLGSATGLEQLQSLITIKNSLDGVNYHGQPLAEYLLQQTGGDPAAFELTVDTIERGLGGALAERKAELLEIIAKSAKDKGADLHAVLNAERVAEIQTGDTLTKLLHKNFDTTSAQYNKELTATFINNYLGKGTVSNPDDITQQLVNRAIGRAGSLEENLAHRGNRFIITRDGDVEMIKGEAALDARRVSEATLRTNYLTSVLGVPRESIGDVRVGGGRSFEFTSGGQAFQVDHAGTGHPVVTAEVDGETVRLDLNRDGQVVQATGVEADEVGNLDTFVRQGPDSFVGKLADESGHIEINGTTFDFGDGAHVRVHEISVDRIGATAENGELPADSRFFVIKDSDAATKIAQISFADQAVFEASTDKLIPTGLTTELRQQAQYLQAVRQEMVNEYTLNQREAADLLAVARRVDGTFNTIMTEAPEHPPETVQRVMQSIDEKNWMLRRDGHFTVERVRLANTLAGAEHNFTPTEVQSALAITRDTHLSEAVNIKLATSAITKNTVAMQEIVGYNAPVNAISVKGERVIIATGSKEFPATVTINGPAAHIDIPGKDVYVGTTVDQLKSVGRIVQAGTDGQPGSGQAEAEKILNGFGDNQAFVQRLTGQEYSQVPQTPKTLVDLIAKETVGKNYAGKAAVGDIFNQVKLDKQSHQLRFDVNVGATDARYMIDERSGVIIRENQVVTERQFAVQLEKDILQAKKNAGE